MKDSPRLKSAKSRVDIINSVKVPLSFFVLALLVAEVALGGMALAWEGFDRYLATFLFALTLAMLIGAVTYLTFNQRLGALKEDVDVDGTSATNEHIEIFDLENEEERKNFYQLLENSITCAEEEIYRSGRGFSQSRRVGNSRSDVLFNAERQALQKGVLINRIQTSINVSKDWANSYSGIVSNHPETMKIYADLSDPPIVNVAVIDPHGRNPIVQLLFESDEVKRHVAACGLFIKNRPRLARSVARHFEQQIECLALYTPEQIDMLGYREFYFAYGSNISKEQLLKRCPNGKAIGIGVLYNWKLEFCVWAPHLKASTAGIRQEPGCEVWGVLFALTDHDSATLDQIEEGGYVRESINVKIHKGQSHQSAFTYIPINSEEERARALKTGPSDEYKTLMRDGALEHANEELKNFVEHCIQESERFIVKT